MELIIANSKHIIHARDISTCIGESAKMRGTGIARRSPEYISKKMEVGNAVIAIENNEFAGFCYIEVWGHGKYVAHSGLIVAPKYRDQGLAKKIKTKNSDKKIFNSGRTCKTFEKGLLIEYYKLLTGTDPPPPKEVKISSNSNCMLIELLLRYLHKKNKDNIHWFSNTNEALINNYK